MTKDEMKNRISLALKDPILQQGFEIICKENTTLKEDYECLEDAHNVLNELYEKLEKENAELKEKLNRYKHDCPNCSAFGKHCPHRVNGDPYTYDCYLTVADLEKENAELKEYNKYLRRKRQGGIQKQYNKVAIIKQQDDQLTKAKDILRMIVYWKSDKKELLNFINKAEQFLKE